MHRSESPNSPSKNNHPPIGIDLGTTYSAITYLDDDGKPVAIHNNIGEYLTPSCILFDGPDIVIGREANRSSVITPAAYAECFKRDMGRNRYSNTVQSRTVPPEVLSALVIQQLKADAEKVLGSIHRVVITVPAFFDEHRRNATKVAARMAGLEVQAIINEPTAAAIFFGMSSGIVSSASEKSTKLMVYDLGGGTFDVSIMAINGTRFQTLATDGDVRLGGKDFDERVVNLMADQFIEDHGLDPRTDPEDCAQMWLDAESIKKSLSERQKISTTCHHSGLRSRIEFTREEFERKTSDLLSRTEITTELVLKESGLVWDDIEHVVLVGGSSRMPMVQKLLSRISGKSINQSISPDQAIASGAAYYAGILSKDCDDHSLNSISVTDVNSHTLGVVGIEKSTGRNRVAVIIPKNTPLPCVVERQFSTARRGQETVAVNVVEGESDNPEQCVHIGDCIVSDLPPDLPAGSPVKLAFKYERDGTVTVSARVPSARRVANARIKRELLTSVDDLEKWIGVLTGTDADSAVVEQHSSSELIPPSVATQAQLDETYIAIANSIRTGVSDPAIVHMTQQVNLLDSRIRDLEHEMSQLGDKSAITSMDRVMNSSRLAQIRTMLHELNEKRESQLVYIGKTCYEQDIEGEGLDSLYDLAEQLLKSMRGTVN